LTSGELVRVRPLLGGRIPTVGVFAVAAAIVVGVGMAVDLRIGVALIFGACALPLVLLDLPLGIAFWAGLIAVSSLPAFGLASTAAGVIVLGVWLSLPERGRAPLRQCLGLPGGATLLVLLLTWITISLAWADDTGKAVGELWRWYVGVLVLAVVATSLRRPRDIRLVVAGFVIGVAASVLIGLVHDGLGGAPATVETLTSTEGRLKGGLGDPNVLAAAIVPALVFATALVPLVRSAARWALLGVSVILVLGLAATQSRGGVFAVAVAFGAAIVVMKRQRGRVLALGVTVFALGAMYFAAYPSGLQRFTASDSGSGRADIWQVAWRVTAEHPIAGVGLHNFTVHSPLYVRRPGLLRYVDLIAERPHVVHNTYLEVLTETGIVGLTLFLAVLGASLVAAWKAAGRFEQSGAYALGTLSRGTLVATLGMLTAGFFVTLGSEPILWLLLALGPALLAIAAARSAGTDDRI
jgi:O-antigen ligase